MVLSDIQTRAIFMKLKEDNRRTAGGRARVSQFGCRLSIKRQHAIPTHWEHEPKYKE